MPAFSCRLGLSIGVATYGGGQNLPNAVRDARQFAESLVRQGGFHKDDVECVTNPTVGHIDSAVRELASRVSKAKPGGLVVFYYTGHGMYHGSKHYMLGSEYDGVKKGVKEAGFAVEQVVAVMEGCLGVLLLDTCRTLVGGSPAPWDTTWVELGPSKAPPAQLPRGVPARPPTIRRLTHPCVLLEHSCSFGQKAGDGKGDHSLFHTVVVQKVFGKLTVQQALSAANVSIAQQTDDQQVPVMEAVATEPFNRFGLGQFWRDLFTRPVEKHIGDLVAETRRPHPNSTALVEALDSLEAYALHDPRKGFRYILVQVTQAMAGRSVDSHPIDVLKACGMARLGAAYNVLYVPPTSPPVKLNAPAILGAMNDEELVVQWRSLKSMLLAAAGCGRVSFLDQVPRNASAGTLLNAALMSGVWPKTRERPVYRLSQRPPSQAAVRFGRVDKHAKWLPMPAGDRFIFDMGKGWNKAPGFSFKTSSSQHHSSPQRP